MMIAQSLFLLLSGLFAIFPLFGDSSKPHSDRKVLICGVCKDIEPAVENTIKNIEELGSRFRDYVVILYENNSADRTATLLSAWAKTNPRVIFISETLPTNQLPTVREERIARARNIVLSIAKREEYASFKYLIMADLDFLTPWPIDEIVKTTKIKGDWDCISANGMVFGVWAHGPMYWDRCALRNAKYPLGPELLGPAWWQHLGKSWFAITGDKLVSVYSAFGGLAVYKRASILHANYSGQVNSDLKKYYKQILPSISSSNSQLQLYLQLHHLSADNRSSSFPLRFQNDICCEHVPFHASMALAGFGKMFINPKMVMIYKPPQ